MREILFRGKRMDTGEWVEGHYNYANWYLPPSMKIVDTTHHILPVGHGDSYEIDINTIGQYTGLTDKNGKKIFEGDIVQANFRTNHSKQIFRVTFDDGMFLFDNNYAKVPKYEIYSMNVIGNIHDNPELLGGGNDG